MANISNRSPWQVKLAGQKEQRFRLKSKALEYLASQGHPDPAKLPKNALKQLETAFEVQIKLADKDGNVVTRSSTHDTLDQAKAWAKEQEDQIKRIRTKHGGFIAGYETITIEQALKRFHAEHYAGKRSFKEVSYRVTHLSEWLGKNTLLRDLTKKDFMRLRDQLLEKKYSASSVRNYFTVLTSLYSHAANEWIYPVDNPPSGISLPKPRNNIQRSWMGNEYERLMASLEKHSPWMVPIVKLALAMGFRRGEIVQSAKDKKTGEQSGGMRWEDVDWDNNVLRLPREKNDHTKSVTQSLGRSVPLTPEMQDILRPLYEASETKSGLIFTNTINSVTGAFTIACAKAKPPITDLTFHSLRKIATKNLSKKVNNPMELSRLTGHKSLDVLNRRYFDVQVEELYALLVENSGTIRHRGISALTKVLGLPDAKKFIEEVRKLPSVEDAFR
jgi:integrase